MDSDGRIRQRCSRCINGDGSGWEDQHAEPSDCGSLAGTARWRNYSAVAVLVAAMGLFVVQIRSHGSSGMAVADSLPMTSLLAIPGLDRAGNSGAGDMAFSGVSDAQQSELDDDMQGGIEGELEADLDVELPPTLDDVLENSDEPLHVLLPTLADWVFPVLGSDETFPLLKPSRRFNAERDVIRFRAECPRGHCGVDLNGPRGTPIVAVAWGVVTRIQHQNDPRSGRYVRIQHPDYVYTSYMHLDEIAKGLRVGDEVEPGQVIGTLGRTGIVRSRPHLHFSLEVPKGRQLKHIDPAPYLSQAARLPNTP